MTHTYCTLTGFELGAVMLYPLCKFSSCCWSWSIWSCIGFNMVAGPPPENGPIMLACGSDDAAVMEPDWLICMPGMPGLVICMPGWVICMPACMPIMGAMAFTVLWVFAALLPHEATVEEAYKGTI